MVKYLFLISEIFCLAFCSIPDAAFSASSNTWVLTNDHRRAFLHYYSPVILKRAEENKNDGKNRGHDWITSFNFDKDGNFSNNRRNWEKEKHKFIDHKDHMNWKIRPTLYTAIIEFMQEGDKSLILLYHVYHALQGCQKLLICINADIHDWERMEIRIDHVKKAGPGHGEKIGYYVLTSHSKHTGRLGGHSDLHYLDNLETSRPLTGQHLLVWQAEWRGWTGPRKGELRFVEDGLNAFLQGKAKVDISGYDDKPFHYVFVNQDAKDATAFWDAKTISYENASTMASGKDDDRIIPTSRTKRITYELQDLADVFPTHWIHANGQNTNINWGGEVINIELVQHIQSVITGNPITIPSGIHSFYKRSRDGKDKGKRSGYPQKHWFWGTYYWGHKGSWTREAYHNRGNVWRQYDYFAHDGGKNIGRVLLPEMEKGRWLPEGWHKAENGGFDGRWVQLFPDT